MIKIPKILNEAKLEMFEMFGGTKYARGPKPERYTPYYDEYSVTINGENCPVRECRVSAMPFNRWWPGHQRDLSQTELAGFITFSGDEKVTLRVKRKTPFKKAVIRPVAKNIASVIEGDEVVFEITENGSYVLELDGEHNCLHIFYNKPKEYPDAKDATYYFGPGLHYPGIIRLKSNESVYVDEEAVVFGGINAIGAENIRIFGGGTIDNSNEERVIEHCYENFTVGCFRIYGCKNVSVEDIIFMNSATWIFSMFYCDGVTVDGVKLIGHWRYNADGIDVVNTSNVTIKNCFIRSFDDAISVKGIYNYDKSIENIFVDNCVLWCGWGHTLELGVETWAPEYKNIHFKNCDCIRISGPGIAIVDGMHAQIHNVSYENISVEIQADTMRPMMQESDEHEYEPEKSRMSIFRLISIANYQYSIDTEGSEPNSEKYCKQLGKIYDIDLKNIYVYTDDENIKPAIRVYSVKEEVLHENITIDGLFLNGAKQENFDKFTMLIENIRNFTFK